MKITDLKIFVVGNAFKNWVFVKLYTDEGITGLGEATAGLSTMPQISEINELRDLVIGKDPLQPEQLWYDLYKKLYLKPTVSSNGIILACWDILGKALNAPVWKLLGGKQRDRLRVYVNGWYTGLRTPQSYAEAALKFVEKGYTALKFDPFGASWLHMEKEEEQAARDLVCAVREAVGNDVDICIESHDRFCVSMACQIGKWLEEYNPFFIEAPVLTYDIEGASIVGSKINIPIATGEQFNRLSDFIRLSNARYISYLQPEVMNLGLMATLKACAIGEVNNQLIACHQAQSPYCTAVNAHIHAVIPNFLIQECFDDTLWPDVWKIFSGVPRIKDGYLDVPDTPGWGVELNEEEIKKYPYSSKNFLRLFDSGWESRMGDR